MSVARLAAEDVTVRFGAGPPTLQEVSLAAAAGECLALLGPNGAGKTTLLRVLHLLLTPGSGRVLLDGAPAPFADPARLAARRRIAWVPQRPASLRGNALDNVAYPLRLRGLGRSEAEARARLALDGAGLRDFAHRDAATLSGGEAQRLAFARATVTEPDVLLLDEFTANLDPGSVSALEGAAGEEKRRGAAVVLVTHRPAQATRLAERSAILLAGRVVESGPTRRVLSAPEDPEARAYLRGEVVA